MRSMTGYGRGVAVRGDARATVDIRAVNHRFLDLKLRGQLPAALEDAIAARVRGAIDRGALVVAVSLRGGAPGGARIDGDAAGRVHRQLVELASQLGVPGPDLALVLAQPGVITSNDGSDGSDAGFDDGVAAAALAAVDGALGELDRMRSAEGAALAAELRSRLDELSGARVHIAALAAAVPQHVARRLRERLKRLSEDSAGSGELDESRLALEIAVLADRSDITEELVRLASHLDQARGMIDSAGPVGRRLDFLIQEIGRELNTIGAKSTTAEISTAVVTGKATLEKIREQVQNVE